MNQSDPKRSAAETLHPVRPSAAATRWIKWLALVALVAGLMYACRGERTFRWEEEVDLSSGERLLLDRSVRLERISAPFNPFQTNWAWRESTIVVREGPADIKGARYEARLLPMLIEREPESARLVVVGISVYCDDRVPYRPTAGERYFAFELRVGEAMSLIRVPDWAWDRRLNLLKPNYDKPPPRHVMPEFANRFNREESRGERHYFVVDRAIRSNC